MNGSDSKKAREDATKESEVKEEWYGMESGGGSEDRGCHLREGCASQEASQVDLNRKSTSIPEITIFYLES
ncbi:unnamed protein product [Caenorhabditis nigoni]